MADQNRNGKNTGKIVEIKGVVLDVVFPDSLPDIYAALSIETDHGPLIAVGGGAFLPARPSMMTCRISSVGPLKVRRRYGSKWWKAIGRSACLSSVTAANWTHVPLT